jgi:hypothetical protein
MTPIIARFADPRKTKKEIGRQIEKLKSTAFIAK